MLKRVRDIKTDDLYAIRDSSKQHYNFAAIIIVTTHVDLYKVLRWMKLMII